jgi:acyl-CoA dehydrogenase
VAWDNVSVTHARDHSGRSVLTGSTVRVCDGDEARVLLTVCPVDGVETLFSVELDQPGVRRRRLVGLDRARIHADITFTGAPATALGPVHGRLERALRLARITVAADLVGVSVRCTELAVDYARQRQQFGRLIGSFQAIKHRCARMFIGAEQARSFVRDAAWRADHATDDVALAAEGALWFAAETAIATTADLIRVLGGTGFTWEHEAHLYFRRARAQAVLFGGQMRRCATVADRVMVL